VEEDEKEEGRVQSRDLSQEAHDPTRKEEVNQQIRSSSLQGIEG
jgi:hypothetical protein